MLIQEYRRGEGTEVVGAVYGQHFKIGVLPKKFHKLLGNEMSSNVRSTFQCGNYWLKLYGHFPFIQGTPWQVTSGPTTP